MKRTLTYAWRLPFLILAIFSLIVGLWTGLSRIGWDTFILPATAHHGAVMVGGFLGSLISLEKVIPLKKKWLLVLPGAQVSAALLFLFGEPMIAIPLLITGSIGLVAVFGFYLKRERTLIYVLMLIGALCLSVGNVLLFTENFYPLAFPWWVGFILFIITAERLELMKFLPVSKAAKRLVVAFLIIFVLGISVSFHSYGNIASGTALVAISLWLLKNDAIAIGLRKKSLTRFVSISLLLGYTALLVAGIFFISFSDHWLAYDALVHTFFIGFAFSMIFAHGPIILPGVLGISFKPYHKSLYLWLILLHTSWLIRVFADAYSETLWRKYSGLLSAITILGYFATIAFLTVREQHGKIR
jgi:hypothetical protein